MRTKKVFGPVLFESARRLPISDLQRAELLVEGQVRTTKFSWGNDDPVVEVYVDLRDLRAPGVRLRYQHEGGYISYAILLVSISSNLGKGKIWQFICPRTQKRCRALYQIGPHFFHREAFEGAMYESQTLSAKGRSIKRLAEAAFGDRPKRTHYAGKPTKRYTKWSQNVRSVALEHGFDLLRRRKNGPRFTTKAFSIRRQRLI